MQFVLISLVILPVLPNRAFGPYQVLNPFKIWLMASRPRTLPAAAAPVLVGTAYAYTLGTFKRVALSQERLAIMHCGFNTDALRSDSYGP